MDLLFRLIWIDQFEQFQKLQNVLLFRKGLWDDLLLLICLPCLQSGIEKSIYELIFYVDRD